MAEDRGNEPTIASAETDLSPTEISSDFTAITINSRCYGKYPKPFDGFGIDRTSQILAPSNDAFKKIPYTELNKAFSNNDQDVITNVLEYHLLQGSRLAAELVPGDSVFIPTLLTNEAYSNVSGGQRVQNVKQSGDVVVFVSGLGNRCTLTQAVSAFQNPCLAKKSES